MFQWALLGAEYWH